MKPKERMRQAMALGSPARVPVMCQMSVGHMLFRTGASPVEFWHDEDVFVEVLLRLRAEYGFDGILVSLHGHRPGWRAEIVERVEREAEEIVRWKDGSRTVFPRDDLPRHETPAARAEAPSIAGFDPASLPAVPGFIPVSQGLRFPIDPSRPYGDLTRILEAAGGTYSIHGEVTSPFDYFLDLFGFAPGFLALVEEPERVKAVLDRLADGVARIARDQAALGLDAVKISSPFAGAGFISPRCYREFVLPYEARVAAAVRAEGAFVYTHTCGAIGDRLEAMAEAGVSGLECLDPPPLGTVDLAEAKRRLSGRLFIKGNVDPVNTLLRGTPESVESDALRRIATGAKGGGYILSTACSIAPRTPPENVRALVGAVEKSY